MLPERRCGGYHSAISCPACITIAQQAREIERLRAELNEIRIRARMGKDTDSVTGMILGDLERYAREALSGASTAEKAQE